MVQDVNDGGREGGSVRRENGGVVRWRSAIRVRVQYGYGGQRGRLASAALPLSPPRLAGSGLAFPLCLAFPVTFDHSASSGIGHWPGSIRLKHTKHTGGSPLCFVCPPTGEDCV